MTVVTGVIGVLVTVFFKAYIYSTLSILLVIAVIFQLLRIIIGRHRPNAPWNHGVVVALNAASIFCIVTILYRMTTMYVGMLSTPAKSYFDSLAAAWLDGRLYLINPELTHDLTFFNGNWYVANPPLVALIMLPYIALFGLPALNTVVFSILFAALNTALIYILLEQITARGWVQLRREDSLWLTALFAFGTAHWYLGVIGKMWFMSQITTLTFLALAVMLAVMRKSPIFQGVALGLAMLARPHIVVFAPLLLGIAVQNARDDDKPFRFGELLFWGLKISLPVVVAGAGLLFYNWLRFGNIFDYGYLTENVADFMAQDLKEYGTFHPHFILRNLRVMFFSLPKWSEYCRSYLPSVQGLSIFIVTPVLVFLAGSLRRKPWVLGAWGSIITTIIPLALYYNTGAWQFGYKYLLDFIIPVILLLAVAAGNRMSWVMRLLILVSIAMNAYGVLWWFGVTVCRG